MKTKIICLLACAVMAIDLYESKNSSNVSRAIDIFNSLRKEGHPVASALYWHHRVSAAPSESKLNQDIQDAWRKWRRDPIGCLAGTVR